MSLQISLIPIPAEAEKRFSYIALTLSDCLFASFRELAVNLLSLRGSRRLYNSMTSTMLRMPLRWIDTTPVGRMLNRVTGDVGVIEDSLGDQFGSTLGSGLFLVAVVASALFASPFVLIFGTVFLGIATYFTRFYLAAAREAKRLESVTKSPILELVRIQLKLGVCQCNDADKL